MDALKEEWPLHGPADPTQLSNTADRGQWDAAAAAVLRKAGKLADDADPSTAADLLSKSTLDGLTVPALGTAAGVESLPATGVPGAAPYTRGTVAHRESGWDVRTPIDDPDPARAARAALGDLERGANSVWLTVGETAVRPEDLGTVLAGVFLDFAPVVLQTDRTADPVAVADAFLNVLTDRELAPATDSNLGADPIGHVARWAEGADRVPAVTVGVAELALRTEGLRAIVVDGTAAHDAGATQVQELAYSLACGVGYLRLLAEAGIEPERAVGLLEFRYATTDDQFLSIATLRAARALWNRVTELSGLPAELRGQRQHAVTSAPMMTRYDPWVNMLRTTVAAFAAGVGGADAVTVRPFDDALGLSEDMARRVARNTSSLLISESHVAKATDPAGGSFAVEQLTDSLARAAWVEFQLIEATGGILAALADGSFPERVRAKAAERTTAIARRTMPLTGLSEFPDAQESLLPRVSRPTVEPATDPRALTPIRYGSAFEELRDTPAVKPVFLAPLGPVSAHTARATFAANLLAAGGITAINPRATADTASLVAAFRATGADVVALAGTDQSYETHGPSTIAALRAAGARWILLAGRPTGELTDLVDDSMAVGIDAVAFLTRTRTHLTESA